MSDPIDALNISPEAKKCLHDIEAMVREAYEATVRMQRDTISQLEEKIEQLEMELGAVRSDAIIHRALTQMGDVEIARLKLQLKEGRPINQEDLAAEMAKAEKEMDECLSAVPDASSTNTSSIT